MAQDYRIHIVIAGETKPLGPPGFGSLEEAERYASAFLKAFKGTHAGHALIEIRNQSGILVESIPVNST